MKAIILAAGMASRLRPLTDHSPKCLLQVGQRTLLQRTVDALVAADIHEFVVVTGYLPSMITDFLLSRYPQEKFHFIHNARYASTNNIYSLWLTREEADGEEVLLLDSDILFDPQIIPALLNDLQPDTLAVNTHELGEEEIKVIVDEEGKVKEISKICSIEQAMGESVGIEKMSAHYTHALFEELQQMIEDEGLDNVFYERAFERLIPQGLCFGVTDTTRFFSIELDTVEDFHQAQRLIPPHLY